MAYLVSPRDYGTLGVVLSLVTLFRVALSTGIPQSATHHMAADPARAYGIWRQATRLQVLGACAITALYVVTAGAWSRWLGDADLFVYLLLSAPFVVLMAWYQMGMAYFGGRLQFGRQAMLNTIYSVARAVLVPALALLGFAIAGAVVGLVIAAGIAAVASQVLVPRGDPRSPLTTRDLLSFSAPIVGTAIGTSVLLNLDILLLKSYFPEADSIGFYNGAMNLGKAPYFVFAAFSATLLPVVSRAMQQEGRAEAVTYARRSVSYLAFASIPVSVIVTMTPEQLLDFVYSRPYVAGAPALVLLVVSMCGLSLLAVLQSVLTGAGRPGLATGIVLVSVPTQLLAGIVLVPRLEMLGTALANLTTMILAVALSSVATARIVGSVYDLRRLLKALAAAVPVAGGLHLLGDFPVPLVPVVYAVGMAVYGAGLVALGALRLADLRRMLGGGPQVPRPGALEDSPRREGR